MADKHPQWSQMQDAWSRGDFGSARDALDRMDDDELGLMRQQLGEHIAGKLRNVRRRRRGPGMGRVVLINGIMGAHLHSIDPDGNDDRVWFDVWSLFVGQMARLELTPAGGQVQKKYRIVPRFLHKTYLPLAMELSSNWDVLHFPFDWRLDMDIEAARLAQTIRTWAQGEPVHIVAHSMGGVLSRRFIQKFPTVWQSMADPGDLRRGGRLVMLGTPNRGSFVIPAMLTGKDKLVKMLSFIDFGESKRRFLRNASSFPGGYQMLPSPVVDLQDDHLRLYHTATWGKYRVIDRHLPMAERFQSELDAVLSPERLIYVAGYGIKTQQRIEVKKPGKFRYEIRRDGDGRVPHSLGVLDDVATQWVQEKHGDLPLNDAVREGMDDLLQLGRTPLLESERPLVRSFEEAEWVDDDEISELTDEDRAAAGDFGKRLRSSRSRATIPSSPAIRYAADALLGEFLGSSDTTAYAGPMPTSTKRTGARPKLTVEVHWGDIRYVRGDIYCVGHYQGVLPQRAEYALDTVVSPSTNLDDMVLRTHTQRGVLRGQLGAVNLYPWAKTHNPPRQVAVAGMGYQGQFGESGLRTLARHLSWAVATLPNTETICTVLIGSGEGGLSTEQSTRGMLQGMADAIEAGLDSAVLKLRFVELYRDKATEILEALRSFAASETRIELRVPNKIRDSRGGRVSTEHSLALAVAALIDAKTSRSASVSSAASTILRRIPNDAEMRDSIHGELEKFAKPRDTVAEIASRIRVEYDQDQVDQTEPAHISFWRADRTTHVAALTNTAVLPERTSRVDPALLDQLRDKLHDPREDEVARYGSLLNRLVMPRDFRSVLQRADSLVIEVDRPMSTVNWEMMTIGPRDGSARDCLALRIPLARQLRTEYSPPPSGERASAGGLRALVIGDPGDPEEGEDLPGARDEALQVARLLDGFGVDVTLRLGAPLRGRGPVSGVAPASLLEVLELLQTQRFDLLHYAGHGDFQDDDGLRSGWLFKGGMLTAAELSTVDSPPRLIVANACLSARTSTRMRTGERVAPEFGDAGLLPSLADECLRRGVRDYIGTAWEVNDDGAIGFATKLYEDMQLSAAGAGEALGIALHAARNALFRKSEQYGALWAAYQHYGDPTMRL